MKRYFGNWGDYDCVAREFSDNDARWNEKALPQPPSDFPAEKDILFASYESESCEGSALILFLRDGVLHEWSGGHCSCNGLYEGGGMGGGPVTWDALALRNRDYVSGVSEGLAALWALVDANRSAP